MTWKGFWDNVEVLLEAIVYGDKPPTVSPMPTPTPKPTGSLLETFCSTIKLREGANPANNNPGNAKYYYGGYLPIYGKVTRSGGGFAVFPTYSQGWLYLENLVKEIIHNHPALTFYQFFAGVGAFPGFSPADDDNDPQSYSLQVAKACGYPNTALVNVILSG